VGDQPFGVYMGASMAPVTLEGANKQLKPVLGKVQSIGPFHFPVCVFYFTVKDNQGYYSWAYEPVVTAEGRLRLTAHSEAHCNKLNNESLEDIVSAVKRWYDFFYATITSSGNDDSLVDDLLQSNPAFQDLVAKSKASPRKPFTPGSEP
jgi:hypothetical protein